MARSEEEVVAERTKQIDYIRRRVADGEMLYSRYTIVILLTEIEALSERCLKLSHPPKES